MIKTINPFENLVLKTKPKHFTPNETFANLIVATKTTAHTKEDEFKPLLKNSTAQKS